MVCSIAFSTICLTGVEAISVRRAFSRFGGRSFDRIGTLPQAKLPIVKMTAKKARATSSIDEAAAKLFPIKLLFQHGKYVASRIFEPGDGRAAGFAGYSLFVGLEVFVLFELDAEAAQLCNRGVDVFDREIQYRESCGFVVVFRVEKDVVASLQLKRKYAHFFFFYVEAESLAVELLRRVDIVDRISPKRR